MGKKVRVCFHYDLRHLVEGTIVRDDLEEPYDMIIQLGDGSGGRFVRASECMYSLQ